MASRTLIGVVGVCVCAGVSSASVTPIPEFVGDAWEGFEGIAPPGSVPAPMEIMDGAGTMGDALAGICMIATSLHSFLTETTIFPYNGNLMGGSVTGWAVFEFDTPVNQFGSYIGTADVLSGGSIRFMDSLGNVLDEQPLDVALGEWDWFGWHSDEPFTRVEIFGNETPGSPLVFDDMQVTFVPSPGSAVALVGFGALGLRRRRR